MNGELDLIVLVADTDAEWTLRTLLDKRTAALGIRSLCFEVQRHPGRDAGVLKEAYSFLRIYLRRARYALVLLDLEGCGAEHEQSAQEIEVELEQRLRSNGWADTEGNLRAATIVLDPELEVWVWSRSPHIRTSLGLSELELQQVLSRFEVNPNGKPQRPKEAMLAALRRSGRPRSARIFQEMAERVSLQAHERAFDKLRSTLQVWFGSENNS